MQGQTPSVAWQCVVLCGLFANCIGCEHVAREHEGDRVSGALSKADKRKVRQLAGIARERELGQELRKIASAIEEMDNGAVSPFEVTDSIHVFHDGSSRDLYRQYADALPWLGICRAYSDRVLMDEDLIDASDEVRNGIREYAASFAKLGAEEGTSDENGRGSTEK